MGRCKLLFLEGERERSGASNLAFFFYWIVDLSELGRWIEGRAGNGILRWFAIGNGELGLCFM